MPRRSCGTVTVQSPGNNNGGNNNGGNNNGGNNDGSNDGSNGSDNGGRRDTGSESNNGGTPREVPVLGPLTADNPRVLAAAGSLAAVAVLSR